MSVEAMKAALEVLEGIGLKTEKMQNAIDLLRLALDEHVDLAKVGEVGVWGHKREWVGLTDEEIYDYADKFLYQHGSNYGIKSFGKAIEATLKEKNA